MSKKIRKKNSTRFVITSLTLSTVADMSKKAPSCQAAKKFLSKYNSFPFGFRCTSREACASTSPPSYCPSQVFRIRFFVKDALKKPLLIISCMKKTKALDFAKKKPGVFLFAQMCFSLFLKNHEKTCQTLRKLVLIRLRIYRKSC